MICIVIGLRCQIFKIEYKFVRTYLFNFSFLQITQYTIEAVYKYINLVRELSQQAES